MRHELNRAPLAITSDGDVLLNIAQFDVTRELEALRAHAKEVCGHVFVGVVVSPNEAEQIRRELNDAALEASSRVAAARQARARRR